MHNFNNDSSRNNPEQKINEANLKSKQITHDEKVAKIDNDIKTLNEKKQKLLQKEQDDIDVRKSKYLYLINEGVFVDVSRDIGKTVKFKQTDGAKVVKKVTKLSLQNCVQRILKNALEERSYLVSDFDKKLRY